MIQELMKQKIQGQQQLFQFKMQQKQMELYQIQMQQASFSRVPRFPTHQFSNNNFETLWVNSNRAETGFFNSNNNVFPNP